MSFKKYASDDDSANGVWRTIGGRRIFIKNGQDLASAMKSSGKFKMARKDEVVSKYKNSDGNVELYKETLNKISEMEYNNEINKEEYDKLIKETQNIYVDKRQKERAANNLQNNANEAYKNGVDKNEFATENAKRGISTKDSDNAYEKAREKYMIKEPENAKTTSELLDENVFKDSYNKYKKEHPDSKMSFEDFKKWFK